RRHASLREVPFLWRVRLRLGLGGSLSAPRLGLLPQAAVRRAFHTRNWAASAGANERVAPALAASSAQFREGGAGVLAAPAVPAGAAGGRAKGGRAHAAHRRAVPLAQPRLP